MESYIHCFLLFFFLVYLSFVLFSDSRWDFVREILNLTLRVLKPGAKFYAQVRVAKQFAFNVSAKSG